MYGATAIVIYVTEVVLWNKFFLGRFMFIEVGSEP